jgi:tRNA (guanine-N7-)-methyltransferase
MFAVEVESTKTLPIVVRPSSYVDRMDVAALFENGAPIEIELGAGDGSFLIQWAGQNRGTNFLALERLLGRLRKIEKKARRNGLENIRGMRIEASYFVEYLLPRESIGAFHIYFPDPWPKRKHRANRLVNEHFTEVLRAALKPSGIVYLRTDHVDYFQQMQRVFAANSAFESIETPQELANVLTDFERGFLAQGIQTNRAAYRKLR